MDIDFNWISVLLYKLGLIYAGVLLVYLGYKLFINGIYGPAGELIADWNEYKIVLKRAAPGTFFVIFGTVFMLSSVFSKVEYQGQTGKSKDDIDLLAVVVDAINKSDKDSKTKNSLTYYMTDILIGRDLNRDSNTKYLNVTGVANNQKSDPISDQYNEKHKLNQN